VTTIIIIMYVYQLRWCHRDLPTTTTGHVPPDKKAKNSPTKLKTTSTSTMFLCVHACNV